MESSVIVFTNVYTVDQCPITAEENAGLHPVYLCDCEFCEFKDSSVSMEEQTWQWLHTLGFTMAWSVPTK